MSHANVTPNPLRQQNRAAARAEAKRRDRFPIRRIATPEPVVVDHDARRAAPLGGKAHEHQRKPIHMATPGKARRVPLVEVPELYRGAGFKAARVQRAKRHALLSGGGLWYRLRHKRVAFRAKVRADGLRKAETR